jgi:hypothetical protein
MAMIATTTKSSIKVNRYRHGWEKETIWRLHGS